MNRGQIQDVKREFLKDKLKDAIVLRDKVDTDLLEEVLDFVPEEEMARLAFDNEDPTPADVLDEFVEFIASRVRS